MSQPLSYYHSKVDNVSIYYVSFILYILLDVVHTKSSNISKATRETSLQVQPIRALCFLVSLLMRLHEQQFYLANGKMDKNFILSHSELCISNLITIPLIFLIADCLIV